MSAPSNQPAWIDHHSVCRCDQAQAGGSRSDVIGKLSRDVAALHGMPQLSTFRQELEPVPWKPGPTCARQCEWRIQGQREGVVEEGLVEPAIDVHVPFMAVRPSSDTYDL